MQGFDKELLAIVRGGPRKAWMDALTIQEISFLALIFGTLEAIPNRRVRNFGKLTNGDRMAFSARGAEILDGGKAALLATLDRTAEQNDAHHAGPYSDVTLLLQRPLRPELDWLRTVFVEHAANAKPSTKPLRLFRQNIRPTVEDPWTKEMFVPPSDKETFRRLSGLTPGQIKAYGIRSYSNTSGTRLGHVEGRYDLDGVRRLLDLMQDLPVYPAPTPLTIQICGVREIQRSWIAVYKLVLEGQIQPVARVADETGLTRLLVARSDVQIAFPAPPNVNEQTTNGQLFTQADLREHLSMSPTTILLLRRLGYLKFMRRRYQGGRTAWTIDIDELVRFDQTYVGCWKLANELGVQPRWLWKKLVEAGVPSIVSGYARVSPVLTRADLPDLLQRVLTDVTA